ncbi:hypothetical protein L9F63_022581 [Diploptera punctata]|uniref:Phospholipase A-2-activating protein n=1 Tax=Diploptera punctata TaxID=6984 RepID=A0AAD8EA96_DIPPU|nr:hypothetical protein L9F63_022581 [Diploptera punctata]
MASSVYKLSCVLYGHTGDVRSVAETQEGFIVSGSRDRSAKIWKPNGINTGFSEFQTLVGHSNYVSSVCVLPANDDHTCIIVTGCNDHNIRAFTLDSPTPLIVLKGHSNTVCSVSPGINKNTVLSGSWDMKACMWVLDGSVTPVTTFSGHEAAVWCVLQLRIGDVVTGSADKYIKIWNKDGSLKSTLEGHIFCVRGLAATSDNEFLSCGNDASIRHWNATTGTCLSTFYGHSNYIYSVSTFPGAGVNHFVTSSEDRTVKIWQGGECQQTVTLPARSVWSVACLQNGDIVTGSSDGVIRIFTVDSSRHADPALQQQFAEEVANTGVAAQQELGGVNINDLPGKEALYEPGRKDGQTKIIKDGTKVFCYSWSSAGNEWVKVGDVLGASGGTQGTSGKQLYNGKEYDYVFSVDIEDGKPSLKLPYNSDEDPWFAAQKFIHDNNLSQMFLDEVANFIIKNSKGGVPPPGQGPASTEYCDPFTGGSRYIPGGNASGSVAQNAADPFTGTSRYVPSTNGLLGAAAGGNASTTSLSSNMSDSCPIKPYFPQKTYLRFDQANLNAILEKLLEFNRKTGDGSHKVEESYLEGVVKLAGPDATANPLHMQVLKQLFEWPKDIVFPVLDVTRLAVRNAAINSDLCSGRMGDMLIDHLQRFLQPDSLAANQMLSVRTLCNMLTHPDGEALALKHKDYLLSILLTSAPSPNKHMQVALSTLLLNLAVAFNRMQDTIGRTQAVEAATVVLPRLSDSEALFRALVALGTLVWDAETIQDKSELIGIVNSSKELSSLLEKLSAGSSMDKVTQCASQVCALMQV